MFAEFGFETLEPRAASVLFGLLLGAAFGALAERSGFCLRRAIAAPPAERRSAAGVWIAALLTALLGTQAAVAAGWIGFADHRFHAADLPLAAIILGGLMFGAGMILARGCVSRLTVLGGTGNLRALSVLLVLALTAHATMKGVLAPLRTSLSETTVPVGELASLAALPGGALFWTSVLALGLGAILWRLRPAPRLLALAVALGALAPLGWVGTGFLLYDDFDPIPFESLSFTAPWADTLFWSIAATSIPAAFGTGLIGGVLLGSFAMALLFGSFRWQSFDTPTQTGRYIAGAALMGVGGVLAGGCTVGAGLSGVPTLSLAAALALVSIIAGGALTHRALDRVTPSRAGSVAPAGTPSERPAA